MPNRPAGRLLACLFALALAAAGCVATDSNSSADLERQVEALREENAGLLARVEAMESYLERLPEAPDVSGELRSLEDDLGDLQRSVLGLSSEIGALSSCVNDYMDTIARWSSNVYSEYRYYYC